MLGSAFDLLEQNLIEASVTKSKSVISKSKNIYNQDTAICPFGVFYTLTKDIAIAIGNEKLWKVFCKFLFENNSQFNFEKYDSNQKRLDNKELIYDNIQLLLYNLSANQIKDQLQKLGIPCGIVADIKDISNNNSYFEKNLLQKVNITNVGEIVISTGGINFENNPNSEFIPAPKLNQHSDEF